MLKERSRPYKILFVVVDFLIILLSWYLAYILRREIDFPSPFLIDPERNKWYLYSAIFGSITHILIFLGSNLYNFKREQNFAVELRSLVAGSTANLAFLLAIIFFFRPISYSRGLFIYQSVLVVILVSIAHYVVRRVLRHMGARGVNARYVLILGTGEAAARFYKHVIGHREFGYIIMGVLGNAAEFRRNFEQSGIRGVDSQHYLGTLADFETKARQLNEQGKLHIIIAALPPGEYTRLNSIYRYCEFESVDMKIIPDYLDVLAISGRVEEIEGLPVISIKTVPLLRGYNWLLKKSFDTFFSLLAVLLSLPFFLLVALLVKATSKGPVFIRQIRMGLDRRPFSMYKFRTMYEQPVTQSDTEWTVKDDPRVTPIGRVLRRYSMDELPQFFNVLKGDMSIVGPRPERPHFVEQFKKEVEGYMLRHQMKAGLTGWAQVNGLRGDTSIDERIKYDIYYIENWSIWFDIRICFRTIVALFKDDGAY